MKYFVGVFGVVITILVGSVIVNAESPQKTIESCGELLPSGSTFTVSISGEISTSEFKAQFNLSDGTKIEDPKVQEAVKPFLNCAMPLVKSGVQPL
jgi:hypothetical protein